MPNDSQSRQDTVDTSTAATKRNQHRRSGINPISAIMLISLGILFLANNFGYLPWAIWLTLWRLWPILLVAIGFRLLLGRSLAAQWVTTIVTLIIFTSAITYAISTVNEPTRTWIERTTGIHVRNFDDWDEIITTTLDIPVTKYANITTRTLKTDIGAAKLSLQEGNEPSYLHVTASHPKDIDKPILTDSQQGSDLALNLSTRSYRNLGWMMTPNERSYDVTLGEPKLPTTLDLRLGAGKASVFFTSTPLISLTMNVGAGSAEIDLNNDALPGSAKLDVGAGSIQFSVPKDTKLTIQHDVGAGRITVDGNTLAREGQFVSDGSGKAVTITAHVGAGTISIERK